LCCISTAGYPPLARARPFIDVAIVILIAVAHWPSNFTVDA
jgi:hypothetical protein